MNRVAVYVDCANLYHTIQKKFKKNLSYKKYLEWVNTYIGEVKIAKAFGAQVKDEAEPFIKSLQTIGFETNWKKAKIYKTSAGKDSCTADWDTGICMDVASNIDNFDILILGSADGDFKPLVDYCVERGKKVFIYACKISKRVTETATAMEIEGSVLQ